MSKPYTPKCGLQLSASENEMRMRVFSYLSLGVWCGGLRKQDEIRTVNYMNSVINSSPHEDDHSDLKEKQASVSFRRNVHRGCLAGQGQNMFSMVLDATVFVVLSC